MKYTIDPTMTYSEAVLFYEEYLTAAKAAGKKPVSFLHFITGRYQKAYLTSDENFCVLNLS